MKARRLRGVSPAGLASERLLDVIVAGLALVTGFDFFPNTRFRKVGIFCD